MTKLCKDCKHYKTNFLSRILSFFSDNGEFDMCGRKKNNNLVTGGNNPSFCEMERRDYFTLDVCGPEGKYFEAKK